LAGQSAAPPQLAAAVEKVLEWRRHVAEARRAAEGEAGAGVEVRQLRIRRSCLRNGIVRIEARNGPQPRRRAGYALDALDDELGQLAHRPSHGVVEDQNLF